MKQICVHPYVLQYQSDHSMYLEQPSETGPKTVKTSELDISVLENLRVVMRKKTIAEVNKVMNGGV